MSIARHSSSAATSSATKSRRCWPWWTSQADDQTGAAKAKIGVFGHGEGGAIALYAAALDTRIDAVCVSGYFDNRNDVWRQPVDRNVFGLLEQFGDAEVASLIAPRTLIVEAAKGPEFVIPPGTGGAPGRLTTPRLATVKAEVDRARTLISPLETSPGSSWCTADADGTGPFGSEQALQQLLKCARSGCQTAAAQRSTGPARLNATRDVKARQARQLHELDRHNQQLLVESADVRREFMKKLDLSSLDAFAKTVEPYREFFANEVIGKFDLPPLPPNVRTRRIYDEPKFTGYEVVMDVFPDVIAYGILLLPKGDQGGGKTPRRRLPARPGGAAARRRRPQGR